MYNSERKTIFFFYQEQRGVESLFNLFGENLIFQNFSLAFVRCDIEAMKKKKGEHNSEIAMTKEFSHRIEGKIMIAEIDTKLSKAHFFMCSCFSCSFQVSL